MLNGRCGDLKETSKVRRPKGAETQRCGNPKVRRPKGGKGALGTTLENQRLAGNTNTQPERLLINRK